MQVNGTNPQQKPIGVAKCKSLPSPNRFYPHPLVVKKPYKVLEEKDGFIKLLNNGAVEVHNAHYFDVRLNPAK